MSDPIKSPDEAEGVAAFQQAFRGAAPRQDPQAADPLRCCETVVHWIENGQPQNYVLDELLADLRRTIAALRGGPAPSQEAPPYQAAQRAYVDFMAQHQFGMLEETGHKVAEVAWAILEAVKRSAGLRSPTAEGPPQ